jgi:hypothetical protein
MTAADRFFAGLAAVWPLYVAFVLLLGAAYVAARGWAAYVAWRESRTPLAIVRRARQGVQR